MENTAPLVSIILPVFNASQTLSECLESLSKQTYHNIEIIAIDDNSSDDSFSILKQFKQFDRRLKIFKNKKRYGLATTLNRAIKRTQGNFVAFMSATDISAKNRVKEQLQFLQSNKKVASVGTQCVFVDSKNKKLDESHFPTQHEVISDKLLPAISVLPETVMVNRFALPKDILKFSLNSYPLVYTDVFMKCIKYAEFSNLQKVLLRHRQKHNSTNPSKQFLMSFVQLYFKATTIYSYRPSLKTLLMPFLTPLRTRFA
jgi:glycosyltransferase involved in cell wall biosynthesis